MTYDELDRILLLEGREWLIREVALSGLVLFLLKDEVLVDNIESSLARLLIVLTDLVCRRDLFVLSLLSSSPCVMISPSIDSVGFKLVADNDFLLPMILFITIHLSGLSLPLIFSLLVLLFNSRLWLSGSCWCTFLLSWIFFKS